MANEKLEYDNSKVEETPKKKMPKAVKIPLIVVGSLVGFLVLVWGGLNILKFPIYADFYSKKKDICGLPGMNEAPTAQGCSYNEILNSVYTTGYESKKAATIYTVKLDENKTISHKVYLDGQEFTGHCGGIATSGDLAYIANDDYVYTVKTSDLADESTKTVNIANKVKVNNQASFVYCDDTYVYVGEFHDGKNYITNNVVGENHAIVTKYAKADFDIGSTTSTPVQIISIRNEVQGFTITPGGTCVMSTSYGLKSSHFYMYKADTLKKTGVMIDGVEVETFEKVDWTMLAPAMMEDLDIYKDGSVITLTEAGSNKYVFGKFFFANHVFSLDIK